MKDKIQLNTSLTVTSPFTSGPVLLTKTHRLVVPAGLNGAGPASMRRDPLDGLCVQAQVQ